MSARSTAAAVRARVSAAAGDPLLRGAYSLALNVLVTSGLGIAFWIAAARLVPAAVVGRDSALVSAMIAASSIGTLNLSAALVRFLPVCRIAPGRVVAGAYGLGAVVSGAGAIGFVLAAPRISPAYAFLARDPELAALWVAAVVAWGVFALQDAAMTALRRAPWVVVENGAFGALKLAGLPIGIALGAAHSVFVAWAVPMFMLLGPVNLALFRRFIPAARRASSGGMDARESRFTLRGLVRYQANDYVAMICTQGTTTLLPVLVVALVGGRRGAFFYMPFTIVSAFDNLFVQVAQSLTVEAALAPARLPTLAGVAVRRFGWILAAGVIVLAAGAPVLLAPFGGGYVHAGAPVLAVMVLASPLRAVVVLFGVIQRVRGRTGPLLGVQVLLCASTCGLIGVLGRGHALVGVGLAWLAASALTAALAGPSVARALRPGRRREARWPPVALVARARVDWRRVGP